MASKAETLLANAAKIRTEIEGLLELAETEDRMLDDDEQAKLEGLHEQMRKLDASAATLVEHEERLQSAHEGLQALEARSTVPAQPSQGYVERHEVYFERSDTSFLSDVLASATGDAGAAQRLGQHQRVQRELDASTASFPGLVVPQFQIAEAVPYARAGRPFANACRRLNLPEYGNQVHYNKINTGSSAAAQTAEGAAVSETDIAGTSELASMVTAAGAQEVSFQALDRGIGIEQEILQDLAAEVETRKDALLINGTGSSGQPAGLLKSGEINSANVFTSDDDSPSAQETFAALVKVANQVTTTRFRAPDFFLLHPRRLAFLQAGLDSQSRPLWDQMGMGQNVLGSGQIAQYGNTGISIGGIPVISDANLPVNLGTGTNEDPGIAFYSMDCALWESSVMTVKAMPKAKSLTHTLVAYSYFFFAVKHDRAAAYSIGSLFEATL